MFVSHCLLNENVRYLGGACHAGADPEVLARWQREGVGICQMPCPEQYAWGGVLKRAIAPAYGASGSLLWPFRSAILALFKAYTRVRYGRLARGVAAQVRDYQRSGFEVGAIVGVAASPSCGVRPALDMKRWLEVAGRCDPQTIDPRQANEAVAAAAVPGSGLFIRALTGRLASSGVAVPLLEHAAGPPGPPAAGPLDPGTPRGAGSSSG